jgi:CHAT domain-containing protein
MSLVRINDLARELEVKSKAILDALIEVGVTEKKTHSSSIEEHEAVLVRKYFRAHAQEAAASSKTSRAVRIEDEIKTKIDLSNISRPGDVLRAIQNRTPDTPASSPTRSTGLQPPPPPRLVLPKTGPRPVYKAPPRAAAPVTKPTAPTKPAVLLPPPTTTVAARPSSEFKSALMPAIRPGFESGIVLPTLQVPSQTPMSGGFPAFSAATPAANWQATQCDRQHIVFIDLGEFGIKYRYHRRDGKISSVTDPIPPLKIEMSAVEKLSGELLQELERLRLTDHRRPSLTELQRLAGKLYGQLIPDELSEILEGETEFADLVLHLPAELALIPWELLCDSKKHFLCQSFKVGRLLQKTGKAFKTAESRRLDVRSGRGALVLYGDTSDLEADKERKEVERQLDQLFPKHVWFPLARTREEVLDELERDYDICHYIGHGKFVAHDALESGWSMRDQSVLTCTEIEKNVGRNVTFPLLIFANSCHSAPHPAVADSEAYVQFLYRAFLRQGVPHYIGTITKVQDHFKDENKEDHYPAAEFARDFYRCIASGSSVGEALGIARREAFAKPGAPIWASYVHYGDPAFQFVEKPIAPQKLLKPRLARASVPVQPTYRDIFVGRFKELGLMRDSLEMLAEGKSSILLVTGEAGSGKSAFLRHLVLKAAESLASVGTATGTCSKRARHDAHFLIREIFGQLVHSPSKLSQPHQEMLTVGELVVSELLSFPQLASLCRPDVILGPDRFRRLCDRLGWDLKRAAIIVVPPDELQIARELEDALQRITEAVPLILGIEDLQWANEASLELFLRLCKSLSHLPVLLLGTYRSHRDKPSGSGIRLDDVLHELPGYGAQTLSLDLEDSKHGDSRRITSFVISYLRRSLPIVSAEQRPGYTLVDTLAEYTGGNALFLAEMVESLRKTNAIRDDCASEYYRAWEFRDQRPYCLKLPESVQASIAARIEELNHELRKTLKIASVLGRDFSLEALVYLSQRDEPTVLSHLDDLIRLHRLISELPEKKARQGISLTMFRFRNRAIHGFVHDQLSGVEQRRLHKKAGEYLENLPSEVRKDWYVQLATHFTMAQEWSKAFDYSLEVARSTDFNSYRSVLYFENALNMLEPVPAYEDVKDDPDANNYFQWSLEAELEEAKCWADCSAEFHYYFQKLYCLKDLRELRDLLQLYETNQDLDESGESRAAIRRALGYPPTKNQTPARRN